MSQKSLRLDLEKGILFIRRGHHLERMIRLLLVHAIGVECALVMKDVLVKIIGYICARLKGWIARSRRHPEVADRCFESFLEIYYLH